VNIVTKYLLTYLFSNNNNYNYNIYRFSLHHFTKYKSTVYNSQRHAQLQPLASGNATMAPPGEYDQPIHYSRTCCSSAAAAAAPVIIQCSDAFPFSVTVDSHHGYSCHVISVNVHRVMRREIAKCCANSCCWRRLLHQSLKRNSSKANWKPTRYTCLCRL